MKRRHKSALKSDSLDGQAFINAIEDLNDGYISKDGKLVLDFLQAIHTAEKRQAELDAQVYAEEKRALKVWNVTFILGGTTQFFNT